MRILRMCFAQIRWFVPVSGFQNLVIMLKVVEQHLFLTVCAAVASVYPLCLSCNNAILRTCDREYEKHLDVSVEQVTITQIFPISRI